MYFYFAETKKKNLKNPTKANAALHENNQDLMIKKKREEGT